MRSVKEEKAVVTIEELLKTVSSLSDQNKELIADAVKFLDDEEAEDDAIRRQLSQRWTRPHSHALTGNLRQEAAKYQANIQHAIKSDAYVRQKFEDNKPFLELLASNPAEVQALLPSNEGPNEEVVQAVAALRQGLGYLDSCIAERRELESQLKALADKDDIGSILMSTQHPHEVVYRQELSKYDDLIRKIHNNLHQQNEILEHISNENNKFLALKSQSASSRKREEVLEALNKAYQEYNELKHNVREGIAFYGKFHEILDEFRTKCKDFAFARRAEKDDLLRQIQAASSRFSSPAAPPMYHQQPPTGGGAMYPPGSQGAPSPASPVAPSTPYPYGADIPGAWKPTMRPVYYQDAPPSQGGSQAPPPYQSYTPPSPYYQYQDPRSGSK